MRIYAGPEHPHEAQSPVKLDVAALNSQECKERLIMSETMTLEDLGPLKGEPPARVYVKKVDAQGRAYATGKRKNAVARVWVKPGAGKITVNGKEHAVYFARPVLQMILKQPLVTAKREGQYDIICTVSGGGLSGQAGAVRHGISQGAHPFRARAARRAEEGWLPDPRRRVVERKKYGRAKARRSFQFSKR